MKLIYFFILSWFITLPITAQAVGINTTEPKSTLDINGNVSFKVETLDGGSAGSATPIDDGYFISLIPQGGSPEFLLPNASLVPGRMYILRNISNTETAQIFSAGGAFFANNSSGTTAPPVDLVNSGNTKTLYFYSDGTNWIYGKYGF